MFKESSYLIDPARFFDAKPAKHRIRCEILTVSALMRELGGCAAFRRGIDVYRKYGMRNLENQGNGS
jgi:hypothetical protein